MSKREKALEFSLQYWEIILKNNAIPKGCAMSLFDKADEFLEYLEKEDKKEDEVPKKAAPPIPPLFLRNIREYDYENDVYLSVRTTNCLKNENIVCIGDLVQHSKVEMLKIPNFGRKSLREIQQMLANMGLHLGMVIQGWPPEDLEKEKS